MSIHQQSNYGTLSTAVNRAYLLSMTITIQSLRWPQCCPFIKKKEHKEHTHTIVPKLIQHACWPYVFLSRLSHSQTHFRGDYTNKWQCCFCVVDGLSLSLSGHTAQRGLLCCSVASSIAVALSEETGQTRGVHVRTSLEIMTITFFQREAREK